MMSSWFFFVCVGGGGGARSTWMNKSAVEANFSQDTNDHNLSMFTKIKQWLWTVFPFGKTPKV